LLFWLIGKACPQIEAMEEYGYEESGESAKKFATHHLKDALLECCRQLAVDEDFRQSVISATKREQV
jgi:hypothetical protein